MRRVLLVAATLFVVAGVAGCSRGGGKAAGPGADLSLAGSVSSDAEGQMEGVLVSAKTDGGTVTVSVFSDAQGRYGFPKGRLKPGKYRLTMRATGYEMADPGVVDVGENRTTEVDLKLQPTRDLAPQLMNAEWLMSMGDMPASMAGYSGLRREDAAAKSAGSASPGAKTTRLDMFDKDRCSMCHSLWYVTRSGHDAAGWVEVLNRMRFHAQGGSVTRPDDQARSPRLKKYWGNMKGGATDDWTAEGAVVPESVKAQAAYLASINLSDSPDGKWKYELKTLPRPKGDETRVILTEYDLPRGSDSQPHDVVSDPDGMIWYQDFGQDFIGRLNPATGEIKEWSVPALRPYPPFAAGGLDVQLDREGNPWFVLKFRGGCSSSTRKPRR